MKLTKITLFALIAFCQIGLFAQKNVHEKLSLDRNWLFYLGDIPFPVVTGHEMSYNSAKAGKSWGAAAPEFNDNTWRQLNLPHDWSVEQPYDSTENVSQGYRKRGVGWYRRSFLLSASDKGKHIELQFDGIATNCTVWFNGTLIHRNYCGYTSIYLDITALAYYGIKKNNISIRVDAVPQEGWWYEGSGIYRHTWLVKRADTHLVTDGVFAQPVKDKFDNWSLPIESTIENSGCEISDVDVLVSLFDKTGKKIVEKRTSASIVPLGRTVANLNLRVNNPDLWSPDSPTLYKVKTSIYKNGIQIDSLLTTCGFRTIRFTVDSGFYLNDKPLKIKGVCNHQDHAGVGVAIPDALWEFRLRKLKEMGVNGYRCSHNAPSNEFLAACDSMGILVMDENRNFNVSAEYIGQLEWMVRRDRNHPSIILWSVFNEEPMQSTENGFEMVRRMSAVVKSLDTTRPVTAAANGGLFTAKNVANAVDVIGLNYQSKLYDKVHEAFPNTPVFSSEDGSSYMVRGEYLTDKANCTHDSYDTQAAPWGETHRTNWKNIAERPFLAGCFIWTGFDYRGEPQPYVWPAASASFGIMDQCGFPKAAFYIHQAQWTNKPVLQLIPHWNWPVDSIGKQIKVMVLTNAEKVKLFLNGKLLSEKKVDKYEMVEMMVPYKPGKLVAIGFIGEKEVSHFTVETTTKPVSIQLIPDRKILIGNGQDAMPVTVRVVDAKGRPVTTVDLPVEFEINGVGKIIGLGNGNPNSHESEKGFKRKLFNGLAQVIIQSNYNSEGKIYLKAKVLGLKSTEVIIQVDKASSLKFVE